MLFGVLTVVVSALVGLLVDQQYRGELRSALDEGLSTRLDALRQELRVTGASLRPPIPDDEAFAQVLDKRGHVVAASPRALETRPVLSDRDLVKAARREVTLVRNVPRSTDRARLRAAPAAQPGGEVVVVVGTSLRETDQAQQRLELALGVGLPLLAAIVSLAGWFLAGAVLAPVRDLIEEADTISSTATRGERKRLSIPGGGEELAELARRLNAMLERIETALEHERAFLDDASHELRTPIAIARAELELARMHVEGSPETARALDSSLEEIQRLDHLATNLLVLARVRSAGPPPARPVDLAAVAHRAAEDLRRVHADGAVEILVEGAATTSGDEAALERAITNVLDNAVRFARSRVSVRVAESADAATVEVVDDGPGFDDEAVVTAFERFAQGPRGHGTAGLGLAIVDAIVAAHGGRVSAGDADGGGAVVLISLPGGPRAPSRPPAAGAVPWA